ncbi:testis-specific protein 10-interacting protein [Suncus etruscus]|uniref:testis-specific protein 10-interacting protein n=1 Tax=Suncus etruscus TaxID=109475 RepID=UPI00210F70FE|nr:testis-specific protein 10-interacting protein [Suncus etruscus]
MHCSQNKGIRPEKTNQTLPDRGHTRQDLSDGFSSGWYMPRKLKESGHPGPLNTKDSDFGDLGAHDGMHHGLQSKAQSARQAGKERKSKGHGKNGHGSTEADLFPTAPRKPSFPFQWAWEGRASLRSSSSSPPSFHEEPQRKPRRKATIKHPETQDKGWRFKIPNSERKKVAAASGCHPASKAESKMPPGKTADPGSELGESPKLQGPGPDAAQEAKGVEGAPSPEERLPQQPGRWPLVEEEESAEAEEVESGWGSSAGSSHLRGPKRRKAKAQEPDRPWHQEKLQRQLPQYQSCGSEKPPQKAQQTFLKASDRTGKGQVLGDGETSLYVNFPNRTFHKRQEATRSLLKTREQQQKQERLQEQQRRTRELYVQQQVARCLAAYTPRASRASRSSLQKLEELRRQERQRLIEYQAELQDIQHRVQARPYLFQQAMQTNARLSVNRRFSRVLSALGLDEQQLLAEAGKGHVESATRKPRRHRSMKTLGLEEAAGT